MTLSRTPTPPVIAVIGLGPRGLVIVERLIARARARVDRPLTLLLFDRNAPGAGLHRPDLPDYLLLNTVAGQLSFTPHPAAVAGHAPHKGPTLAEWCRAGNIRMNQRGEVSADPDARCVADGDFLPRRLLGAYLEAQAADLLSALPAHVSVERVPEMVVDILAAETAGGLSQRLVTESGRHLVADAVFLSPGHPREADPAALGISREERVVVPGLGLTAMDTVAALTRGRGGLYAQTGDGLRYVRSGREPALFLYSRSGLPFHARPDWSPAVAPIPPVFLTRKAIDRLRKSPASPGGQLCFRTQMLPLLVCDMRLAFHVTRLRLNAGEGAARSLMAMAGDVAASPAEAAALFAGLGGDAAPDPVDALVTTTPWQGPDQAFSAAYQAYVAHDLVESARGLAGSPRKAAAEVWRNQRDILRYGVNGEGLTPASRAEFYATYAPLSNRLVGGPQKERHAELLALCAAGVITLLPPRPDGPGIAFGRMLPGHTGPTGTRRRDSQLLQALLASGRLTAVDPGRLDGIRVDANGHPLDAADRPDPNLWVIGPAVEGASFYNHYVGTPAPDCPLFIDAEREIGRLFDRLDRARTARAVPAARSALPDRQAC